MPTQQNITIYVDLDDEKIPERISWTASDAETAEPEELKAFVISFWDKVNAQTLRMDLWTKDMRVDEMDTFFFQTFMTMADTYQRSNGDPKITDDIRKFAYRFGERTKLIRQSDMDQPAEQGN